MSIFVYFPIYKWESPLIWRIILTKNFNILISRGFEIVTKTSNLKKNWISFLFFFLIFLPNFSLEISSNWMDISDA